MRSGSPSVSDVSTAEYRGLFVRPQQVLYVLDAVGDLQSLYLFSRFSSFLFCFFFFSPFCFSFFLWSSRFGSLYHLHRTLFFLFFHYGFFTLITLQSLLYTPLAYQYLKKTIYIHVVDTRITLTRSLLIVSSFLFLLYLPFSLTLFSSITCLLLSSPLYSLSSYLDYRFPSPLCSSRLSLLTFLLFFFLVSFFLFFTDANRL